MSIVIDPQRCRACGACAQICPGSLISQTETGSAYIRYPRDCWGCASCLKECRFGAISFYLGADIGGMGSRMTVQSEGDTLCWNVRKQDGTVTQTVIDRKESNQY